MGAKFTTESGRRWLVSWIRDPVRHAPRTLMPSPLLEPVPLADKNEAAVVRMTDPAADLAAYLLSATGWQPKPIPPLVEADLDDLAVLHLSKTFPESRARQYVERGIPPSMADVAQGDDAELLGPINLRKKLRYVGRRVLRTRGCHACHEVPGLEDAQQIGPALSDWGRKRESLLAFGQVHQFLEAAASLKQPAAGDNPDLDFFTRALHERRREGFIWQKLRGPRSFDYGTTRHKPYDQWLTMPRFEFTQAEREAIITFVLGLVAEPPADRYVYHPDTRRRAIVAGRKVLDKYACAECHALEMERWTFEFDPDEFVGPPPVEDYDFLQPQFSPAQIAASLAKDDRGLGRVELVGMPQIDAGGELLIVDEDEDAHGNAAFQYGFTLWEPIPINGQACTVGGADVLLWGPRINAGEPPASRFDLAYFGSRLTTVRPAVGGAFARLLYPVVLAEARAAGVSVAGSQAWGWVPPPLTHEGAKVRPAWLHDYLLDPRPIRPAAVLRMPRYNLSASEAGKLVDYFAAVSEVGFPYVSDPGRRLAPWGGGANERLGRLDEAMRILTDTTIHCGKCHQIGDFSPGGQTRTTLAPNLEEVARRLRPSYVRRWLANPRSVLPYAPMPVNFPPSGEPIDPQRFPGDSREQLDAMTDLLLDYDWYVKRQMSIRARVDRNAAAERSQPAEGGL